MNYGAIVAQVAADFGDQVRALMAERGLSQARLAKMIGSHRPIVCRVLRGKHSPTLETVAIYAAALDCDAMLELFPLEIVLVPRSFGRDLDAV